MLTINSMKKSIKENNILDLLNSIMLSYSTTKKLIFFLILLFLLSCEEKDDIGLDQVKNEKQNVIFSDTLTINAYSVREDSIKSNLPAYHLLGNIIDAEFGKTSAGFCSQVLLSKNNINFGNNPVADSLVIWLAYNGYYGDTTAKQKIQIYEIDEDISLSNTYYSTRKVKHKPDMLAELIYKPKLTDSVSVGGMKYAPHLRIKLNNSFTQSIIQASINGNLTNNTQFLTFFKGFYFAPDTNYLEKNGAIIYFNLLLSHSKMTIYYHNDDGEFNLDFIFDSNCARFNVFNHYGYINAANSLKAQIYKTDTVTGNDLLFLQSMGGIKSKINFPFIKDLQKYKKIIINKAELVVKVDEINYNNSSTGIPDNLLLMRYNDSGTLIFAPDYYLGTDYFGGTYNSDKKEYRFNLSLFTQYLLNDIYKDKNLYMMIEGAAANAQRVVINGAGAANNKTKLEITYTIMN